MINFLQETLGRLDKYKLYARDIKFIGSSDGRYECSFDEFKKLSDFEYDNSFGLHFIPLDLVITFKNGGRLIRQEYDGAEGWAYIRPVPIGVRPKKILRLKGNCPMRINDLDHDKDVL